jgi:hypothetical protein
LRVPEVPGVRLDCPVLRERNVKKKGMMTNGRRRRKKRRTRRKRRRWRNGMTNPKTRKMGWDYHGLWALSVLCMAEVLPSGGVMAY